MQHLEIPFTGAGALATTTSCDKLITKQILKAHRMRTPEWLTEAQIEAGGKELDNPYILKSITEHASYGIFADSIVNNRAELMACWLDRKEKYGTEWFAEEYIDGREFNISCMSLNGSAIVLPPAEIVFTSDFPDDKPRIVDYAAKWHEESAECIGTVRNFSFSEKDAKLVATLRKMTLDCWQAFGLTGYARVDYRVNEAGVPFVLEVNCNPFLTAKEGFGAAASQMSMTFTQAIRAIVAEAYERCSKPLPGVIAA